MSAHVKEPWFSCYRGGMCEDDCYEFDYCPECTRLASTDDDPFDYAVVVRWPCGVTP